MDSTVSEYNRRRAERLAVRGIETGVSGIRPKYNPNWDWPLDITSYQKRRTERLKKRGIESQRDQIDPFRFDEPDDDSDNNNQGGGDSGGGHGNTRLPFGLCKRFGIEVGADWGPREAWDALAGRGITPDGAYARLKEGKDPGTPDGTAEEVKPEEPKKSVNVSIGDGRYKVTGSEFGVMGPGGRPWVLKGTSESGEDVYLPEYFSTKREMLQFLKDQGVEEFPDPETGELLNPKEMELPNPVTKIKMERYGGMEYDKLSGRYVTWAGRGSPPWRLSAKRIEGTGDGTWGPSTLSRDFYTKEDMFYWLKDRGVEEFVDPETKETVNPKEMELPKRVLSDGDRGYSEVSIGLRDGKYTIVGKGLDGKKRSIESFGSLAQAKRFLEGHGMNPDDAKLSPSMKKREKERLSWLTSDKKEYLEEDGIKYGDLELKVSSDWRHEYEVVGSSESGEKKAWGFSTLAEAKKFMKEQGVQKYRMGKESYDPQEYEPPVTVAKIGNKEFQEIGFRVRSYGGVELYGVDLDGKKMGLGSPNYRETFNEFKERIFKDHGLTDSQITISDEDRQKIEEIQKAEAEKERRRKEFEEKAMSFGSYRYMDPELKKESDGDYRLVGYDKYGDEDRISSWGDFYDMDNFCETYGYNLSQFIKDPDIKAEYDKYKEARKDFDAKAVEVGGRKYAGLEITYDGWDYMVKGMDERGRTKVPVRESSLDELEKKLGESGITVDSLPMDDMAKTQKERAIKARELIATGEYYGMGKKDSAFKDLRAEKEGHRWRIVGTDADGKEKEIDSVDSWDDAITRLESEGVKDYKVKDGETELGKPKMGLHGVTLMRKPGGGFVVMAATSEKPRSAVYETDNEKDARAWLHDNNVPTSSIKTRGMNPNDDVPRTHTQKSLQSFDTHRMKAIEGSFIDDMTEEEKQEAADMLTEIFNKGEYRAARGLKHFGDIIENGYKSQLETGTGGTGAAISRDGRISCSKKMYGHGDIEDQEYEKMGYLAPADDAEDYDDSSHPFYGPMTFTFKKENMKDRATYTWGDSLNTRWRLKSAGYAGEHPTIEGFTSLDDIYDMRDTLESWRDYKEGKIDYNTMFKKVRRNANNGYIEMQFNGPVTVDDISKASWQNEGDLQKTFDRMKEPQRKRVLQILKDKGIQLIYKSEGSFIDAWDFLKKKYPNDVPA